MTFNGGFFLFLFFFECAVCSSETEKMETDSESQQGEKVSEVNITSSYVF